MAGTASNRPRAAILVTGTEVLSGSRTDRNGPWLAERLRDAGLELTHIDIVGDRRDDILDALRFMAASGVDLIVTSGGLGPTADDITAEVVAELHSRPPRLDEGLERRIAEIVEPLRRRFPNVDAAALAAGTRKQAMVPAGALVLEPVGTAPGLVVPASDDGQPLVVVLPGPPRELQPMWRAALETAPLRALLARTSAPRIGVIRLHGIPESEIAATLRAAAAAGIPLERLEVTTCLHRGEIEVTTSYDAADGDAYDALADFIAARHADTLFSADGSTVDEQVAKLLADGGLTIATAESCTGGLLAARLTDRPGSSAYVRGGVVVYADDVKSALAGVEPALIERHGAVSQEVAVALADGVREHLRADVGVGITGIAGPGGGSAEKPVGLVWLSVALAAADGRAHRGESDHPGAAATAVGASPAIIRLTRSLQLPGSRADVRERAVTVAMHLLRRLLAEHAEHAGARGEAPVAPVAPTHS